MAVLNMNIYFYYDYKSNKIRTALHIEIPFSLTLLFIVILILLTVSHKSILIEHCLKLRRLFFDIILDFRSGRRLSIRFLVILIIFLILVIKIVKIVILIILTEHALRRRYFFLLDLLQHGFAFHGPCYNFINEFK